MKILFMAQDVTPSARTGDAIHVRVLVWHLADFGHDVILIGRDLQGSTKDEYLEYQKSLDIFRGHQKIQLMLMKTQYKLSFSFIKNLIAIKFAWKVLNKKDINAIYSRSLDCKIEAFLSKFYRIPLFLEINGLIDEEREEITGKKESNFTKKIILHFRKLFLKYPKKIIAITPGIKNTLHNIYDVPNEKMIIIPNAVDINTFKPMNQIDARNQIGLDKNVPIICFIGNLAPWYGFKELINASNIIVRQRPNVLFLIVGEGTERDKLISLIKKNHLENNYLLIGSIAHQQIPLYVNASDLCLCTAPLNERLSKSGSAPMKMYEYMACGKPIVVSNLPYKSDVIRNANSGLVVNPEDSNEFSRSIIKLLDDKQLQYQMGQNGIKYIKDGHTWKQVVDKINEVLKS